ncbi:hypothetical protein FO510_02250 [Bacillus pumilus]|nr:conserved hypothetical protein [Bacillus pumilus ATCC 7061]MDR4268463.1 hypothetical protein [Bacillus pumilus]PRS63834.1 hypothetical protein C6X97_08955 [Bacillus pumilus]PRS67896.1 hypothetical protein C6X98_07560 [Bacillus pumilus]PRS68740.1 hypothetical protein C6X98_04315 [Bacillus pumilus]
MLNARFFSYFTNFSSIYIEYNQKPCKITLHEYVIYDFSLYNEELRNQLILNDSGGMQHANG